MNWYKIANLIDPQVQQQFIGWGKAQNIPENIIKQEIQRLIQQEEQKKPQLTQRAYEQSTWVKRQFGKFIQDYKKIPQQTIQQDQKEDSLIVRKAKGINKQYYQWILKIWEQNSGQKFDQSVFDYLEFNEIDPLQSQMTYGDAKEQSEQWHIERYQKKEKSKYITPVTAGEPVGDMFMVELIPEDEEAEGINMQHCVGEMCHVSETNKIYSLRDKKNNPHVTIEINKGIITQVKGKQNQSPISKYMDYVVAWIASHPEIKIDDLEEFSHITAKQLSLLINNMNLKTLLIGAVRVGSWKLLKKAIEMGANNFNDAMNMATWKGRLDFLKYFVEQKKSDLFSVYDYDEEEEKDIIVNYDNYSGTDDEEFAILEMAIRMDRINIVRYFIEKFKKSQIRNKSLFRNLITSIGYRRYNIIKLLLDENVANLNENTEEIFSSIRDLKTLKFILNEDPNFSNVVKRNLNKQTLSRLIRYQVDINLIKYFMDQGVELDKDYFYSDSIESERLFENIGLNGNLSLLNLLIKNDPNLINPMIIPPHLLNKYCLSFIAAASHGELETLQFLVSKNVLRSCDPKIIELSLGKLNENIFSIPEDKIEKTKIYLESLK